MGFVRFCACCLGIGACLVTVGCGGSSEGTTGGTTVPGGSPSAGNANGRRAIHEPVQSRGIKGEDPRAEAATTARISAGDCAALGRLAERRLGDRGRDAVQGADDRSSGLDLSTRSDPKPPLSRCEISGRGVSINVYLDSGFAAHQRYGNRIAETVQFNTENPAGLPQAVPHVGEKAAYNADANWIPALRSLLALRGNRWLTVTISVAGKSDDQLRDEAAALARAGFKLSAS
ncbi:MAG TPA: hypothetical protein VH914_14065 [Acidimicrobiia bacterium]|jgi:hypothetical protein|nr:hypothetical protein [Acidimicrobiia bacterium]